MAREDVQKLIIEGANRLFLQHGCKKVSMDMIAQELHVSKRTIYELFADKETLLRACLSDSFQCMSKGRDLISQDESPLLTGLVILQSHEHVFSKMSRMVDDLRNYYPEIYEEHFARSKRDLIQNISKALVNEQQQGNIRSDVNIEHAAQTIVFLSHLNHENDLVEGMDLESANELLMETAFTYVRGLMTIATISKYEEKREELLERFRTIHRHGNDLEMNINEK